ncbi:MAG: pilus assembly protein TadG-related protein [Paracoccaceae bacterium]
MKLRIFKRFKDQTDGSMTALGLFLGMASIAVGGLAIDVANAMMARTQLQVAADAAAHAALYIRDTSSASVAKSAALELANVNMPSGKYGSLFTADDIQFGDWDRDTQVFTANSLSKNAVRVDLSRLDSKNNSVGTYFLKFVGIGSWDIRRMAVFETYIPTCFREGFVSDEIVDMQSNNTFTNGFCIHANDHVEMNNDNSYASNTVVSMPTKGEVVTPSSDYSSNPGLSSALRDGAYQIRILNRLPDIIDDLANGGAKYAPDYVTGSSVITVTTRNVRMSDFTPGRIHYVSCNGSQKLRFLANTLFSDIVVVTNCRVEFGAQVELNNVIVATTSTHNDSMASAAQFRIGLDDNCETDGGTQLLTLGGMSFPAQLEVFGSQLIAIDDITFTANAFGIEGASFISGGTISGTSNMTMGFCNHLGMERNFEAEYFRLAI